MFEQVPPKIANKSIFLSMGESSNLKKNKLNQKREKKQAFDGRNFQRCIHRLNSIIFPYFNEGKASSKMDAEKYHWSCQKLSTVQFFSQTYVSVEILARWYHFPQHINKKSCEHHWCVPKKSEVHKFLPVSELYVVMG